MAIPNKYKLKRDCDYCNGVGTIPAGDPSQDMTCMHCNGSGKNQPYEVDKLKEAFEEIKDDISAMKDVVDKIWNKVK